MHMRIENPRVTELKIKTSHLRDELAELLGKWFYMKNVVYPQAEYRYHQLFGEVESEIERLNTELRKLKMQHFNVKLANSSAKSLPKLEELNNVAEHIFSRVEKSIENNQIPELALNIDYEISYLYRQLVKKLHPDTTNELELFNKYWINVQDAYQTKNIYKLRLFHKIVCFDEYLDLVTMRNRERVLNGELNELEKSIKNEKKKINRLMMQEPFVFMNKLYDDFWIEDRKKFLDRKLSNIKERIKVFKKEIMKIEEENEANIQEELQFENTVI